ncbi:MAG: hypothetical protein SPK09_07980 [Porphyromonas sp.]|nr:hypothetical protein [Porphyromonas sp.]
MMTENKKNEIVEKVVDKVFSLPRCGLRNLTEKSINRMLSHANNGYFCISAYRSVVFDSDVPAECSLQDEYEKYLKETGQEASKELEKEWLKERNKTAGKELEVKIQKAGYSYSQVYGGYKEEGGQSETYEPSYVVYNRFRDGSVGDADKMREFAIQLAKDFKQESVLVKMPDGVEEYVNQFGQAVMRANGNVKLNNTDEMYFTTSKRKKSDHHRFTLDMEGVDGLMENFYYSTPGGMSSRVIRTSKGEILLC